MIGRTLSHYRIAADLGAGGLGEVYRATDTRLDRLDLARAWSSEMDEGGSSSSTVSGRPR